VHYLKSFRRQQEIAQELAKLGCKVEFQPAEPTWIPAWLDRDLRHDIVRVEAKGWRAKPMDYAPLAELPKLHTLIAASSSIRDEDLKHIGRCRNLRVLALWQTNITDVGLAELAGLTKLERVDFHHSNITGLGFASWQKMPALKKLHLHYAPVTDEGLSHLAGKTPALIDFTIYGLPATGEGFADWKPVAVHELYLCPNFNNAGAACLTAFPHLRKLHAENTKIEDGSLASIGQLTELEELYLCGTRVTTAGLMQLRCSNLQRLIAPSDVDVSALTKLQRERFPQCAIDDGVGSWSIDPIASGAP
jgi:Leucine-rich repeat (LRR) protein